MAVEIVRSTCPHDCPSACALDVERLAPDRVGRVHGGRWNPYIDGVICAKVARYAERVHNPDRLTTPLLRDGPKGSGRFKRIGWDEALDRVAEAFAAARRRHGPQTLWPYNYAGTMGLVQRDGIQRFRALLGTSLQHDTFCTSLGNAGWAAGMGAHKWGVDPREMVDSDVVVLWGLNAVHTQVQTMGWVARARKARGAKLVVVDPYRNATAEKADLHLMLRPGTDAALACAVMHVLFRDGLADRAYLAASADDPEGLEAHLRDRTPAWAARITGLSVDEIETFARLYGGTRRAYLRIGYGFTRSRNGAAAMHAVTSLPAVSGAWAHRGGGALWSMSGLFPLDTSLITAAEHRDGTQRWLDMSRIGAILTGDEPDALAGGPPVTAMLIQNTNPMVTAPDSTRVARGFAREDLFVCVHDQILTETARMADVVLPATTFLEHDDLYKAGAHTVLQVGLQVIEPLAEARCNHDVLRALMARLEAPAHVANDMSARELVDETLRLSGLPPAREIRDGGGHDCAAGFDAHHFRKGFGHADGRFRFHGAWHGAQAAVMPDLPDHLETIEAVDADHPFRLVTAPARHFLNSSFNETPTSRAMERRPTVLVHPDDAARVGLTDGAPARLGNRRGIVTLRARLIPGLAPGTVVVESLWSAGAFPEGVGINALVGADPGPPNGGAVFHDTAVWLRPVAVGDAEVPAGADAAALELA
ncbi:molybdopterin oxidoreductase family protein [Roseospira visakhapatnamensis]|uniref:Anaerobic selenocysteine-containing dehydrogenase n=1 Tax=Roseospira visakhapatnamensis TaxID=390880 RepID=A0A7W6WAC8_9PROT|nr:molybdopterin oxidoreductase family protein [Roseospira visakhapatnamensis]MBB4266346.1 anaerobic selenocysteine-containing dehydrogenase [Roseospira visakhapatnamensis]